jgi:hypothetical protein
MFYHRPGAAAGLEPGSLQYSVAQPSLTTVPGQSLALTVMRKGSTVPLFDTAGHRWVLGLLLEQNMRHSRSSIDALQ